MPEKSKKETPVPAPEPVTEPAPAPALPLAKAAEQSDEFAKYLDIQKKRRGY